MTKRSFVIGELISGGRTQWRAAREKMCEPMTLFFVIGELCSPWSRVA